MKQTWAQGRSAVRRGRGRAAVLQHRLYRIDAVLLLLYRKQHEPRGAWDHVRRRRWYRHTHRRRLQVRRQPYLRLLMGLRH